MKPSHDQLTGDERALLASGHHDDVAAALSARGRHDLAGWVYEQVWNWDAALSAYRQAARPLDVLRMALESGAAKHLDPALEALEQQRDPAVLKQAVALLTRRRRPQEAARLHASLGDAQARSKALIDAGNPLQAATVLADDGRPQEALSLLRRAGLKGPRAHALAARFAWDLGDAEGAAHHAQRAARDGAEDPETTTILANALIALGHDLAAQIVLRGRHLENADVGVPGRYRVSGLGPPGLVGASYVGIDRVTLQEVEVHLLLAEQPDGPLDDTVISALERFARAAQTGQRLAHPAIRPVLRIDPSAGVVVMPRAEGPNLRSLIRSPGMQAMPSRARALIAFLLEGLEVAHARGLVHGWLLPSHIACDAAGRPMLGPFGAYHLSGLAATRTGSLEELMVITAPEIRSTAAPTTKSDLFAIGALLQALLVGRLSSDPVGERTPELDLAAALMHPDPEQRPTLTAVLRQLRAPIADVRELEVRTEAEASRSGMRELPDQSWTSGVTVTVPPSWSDDALDALCRSSNPWMQTILDRIDRTVVLAPWPEGSKTLGQAVRDWESLLDPQALDLEDDEVQQAIRERLQPASLVRVPCSTWMLALDDLLSR